MSTPDSRDPAARDAYLNAAFDVGGRSDTPAPISAAQILFSFEGRVSRQVFWLYGVLGLTGTLLLIGALLGMLGVPPEHMAHKLVPLLLLWPSLAIAVKRWHDQNRSAWWILIGLIPFVGWLIALIMNGFIPGTPGPNRYGQDPLGRAAPEGAPI